VNDVILHSKWEQGAIPVKAMYGFRLFEVGSPGELVKSKAQVMRKLYGNRPCRISFDRYFGVGRYEQVDLGVPILTVEEMFASLPLDQLSDGGTGDIVVSEGRHSRSQAKRKRQRPRRVERDSIAVGPAPELGIDLSKRSREVARLMYKGFGAQIAKSGYDPDDILQEIYRGILSRNEGKCPYDPRKSSFSHYVYMVCHCVLMNIHRIEGRRRSREGLGAWGYYRGESIQTDVASNEQLEGSLSEDQDTWETIQEFRCWVRSQPMSRCREGRLAVEILPLMFHGYTTKEIAEVKDLAPSLVSKAVRYLKSLKEAWFN